MNCCGSVPMLPHQVLQFSIYLHLLGNQPLCQIEKRAYTGALAKWKEFCYCSADERNFLSECALITINGNIPSDVDRLLTYEKAESTMHCQDI